MNIFILDDDENIVQALYKMIERSGLPLEKTMETCSLGEALKIVTENYPDIILTDIRMPGLSGLEFIQELKRRGCRSKVIFMSGYKEFEYVQEAIHLGAHDYLVKPFNEQKLVSVLTSVMEVIEQERMQSFEKETLLKKNLYHSLASGFQWDYTGEKQFDGGVIDSGSLAYYVLSFDLQIPKEWSTAQLTQIETKLRRWDKEVLLPRFHSLLLYEDVRHLAVICSFEEHENKDDLATRMNDWGNFKDYMEKELGLFVIIGVSSVQVSISDLPRGFQEARQAAQKDFFIGSSTIHLYSPQNINAVMKSTDIFQSKKMIEHLILAQHEEAKDLLMSTFERIKRDGIYERQTILSACTSLIASISHAFEHMGKNAAALIDFSFLESMETLDDLQRWMHKRWVTMIDSLENARQAPNDQLIEKVKAYCLHHYAEDITLQLVAEFVGYNKAYFSSMFKKATNVSFWDYLTQIRIDKAKELLETSQLNAYEIGKMVGYHNPSHFGKMFKDSVGLTPAEFKAKMTGFGK